MPSTAKDRVLRVFRRRFGREPSLLVRAPGRVNLIGEHVDYNEGLVLPAATDRAAWIAAAPAAGDAVTIEAGDLGERTCFGPADVAAKIGRDGRPLPAWALYPAGVAAILRQRGLSVAGADVALASDVPIGAGLSSSAAIEVAFAVLWRALGGWEIGALDLARLCQEAENAYVGVSCGLMDPFTILHGRRGHALLLDCRSLRWKAIPLPAATVIVVADTKVRRRLAASEFNLRRRQCEAAVEILRRVMPAVRSLRDVAPTDLEIRRDALPAPLFARARHVVEEIARVRGVTSGAESCDAAALGRAMTAAHLSARDLYEASCYELDLLVDAAVGLEGCYGARLTGAGFGGCTVNLVAESRAQRFCRELERAYRRATGVSPDVWVCEVSDGAGLIVPATA